MKNLKLIRANHKVAVQGDNFCVDFYETIYFVSNSAIYMLEKDKHEVEFCSPLDLDDQDQNIIGVEFLLESNSIFIISSRSLYLYGILEKQINNIGIVDSGIEEFAWGPCQEFLVILTEKKTFILMTKDFDPITEKALCAEEFGENEPVTVGWGSKTTQFHGSEGKGAALLKQKEPVSALSYDDLRSRISWRNDGEYFVTSSINETKGYRQLRIWSKDGILQFTGEMLENIEESISWRPNGDLIACSQQSPNKHKIIFIEKNGLKHGEFALPFLPNTYKVTQFAWSNDSSILVIAAKPLSDNSSDFQVTLWTTGNYHWYLKQKFVIENCSLSKNLVVKWNTQSRQELHCYNQNDGRLYEFKYAQLITQTPLQYKCEDSLVVSIDNENILVSPFGKLVVPPPLCGYKFALSSSVQSVFFAPDKPAFAAYLENSKLVIFIKESSSNVNSTSNNTSNECKLQLVSAGGNGFKSQVQPYSFHSVLNIKLDSIAHKKLHQSWPCCLSHWTWLKNNDLLCICYQDYEKKPTYSILHLKLSLDCPAENKDIIASIIMDLDKSVVAMCTDEEGGKVAIQFQDGDVRYVVIDELLNNSKELNYSFIPVWEKVSYHQIQLVLPCPEMLMVSQEDPTNKMQKDSIVGFSQDGYFHFRGAPQQQFFTSFFIQGGFLFYTLNNHTLTVHQFDASKQNGKRFPDMKQSIERNAKIVFVPPESTKVILQMPRGNLETIHPRPLVLAAIFQHLDKFNFNSAFELSKVHRIDLNVLCDYNPNMFLNNINLFVEQLDSKSLNLFLANIRSCNVCKQAYNLEYEYCESTYYDDKINILCDKIRNSLNQDNKEHFLPYLATYALKQPSSLDEALLKIKSLKDSSTLKNTQDVVNRALDFLLYLVDVNELIDVAFGTYDLETTIMVAQKSQRDPKEFLPFYNNLQNLEENYRKYKIDMQLNRHKKALQHISKCDDHFDECLNLIKEKKLFLDALYLFPSESEQNKAIWTEYGLYLESKGYHDEAGLLFSRIGANELAFKAYRECANWRECLNIAYKLKFPDQKILGTAQYLVERLKDKRKYLDAGYLLEHIIKDIEEAVVTVIEGCEWSNALYLMSKYDRFDIADTHLKPSLIMLHKTLIPELDLLTSDFTTHLARLKYLRSPEKKKLVEEAAELSKYDDLTSELGSVSDVTSTQSDSTRMSGSIMTRKSSKSRRKQQLKKYRLKEGSPDEDLAIIVALSEIVRKVDGLKDNFLSNVTVLVQHGFDTHAQEIQRKMKQLVTHIEKEMPYIWSSSQTKQPESQWSFGPNSTANTIAASLNIEDASTNPVQLDPQLAAPPWRNMDIFLNML